MQSDRPQQEPDRCSRHGAIATTAIVAAERQPTKTPAAGWNLCAEAARTVGRSERSGEPRSGRGHGAPRDHEHGELGPRASQRDSRCAPE